MTFYEAALRVLEAEGRPLHFLEITEKSIQQSLLSHIGKMPEQTMLSRLAAMARRKLDRKVMVTAKDTFALVDWALPEDPDALAQTGAYEEHPEEGMPPLRPAERHPEPRQDNVRAIGRSVERGKHRREEEERGRRRRFPPIPEVVFEILSEEDALTGAELVSRAQGKELASQEISAEQLLTALLEDNQRRIDAGRRPQFLFEKQTGKVSLERAGAPSEAPPLELQAAFAEALGIPLEGGRPVLRAAAAPIEAGIEAGLNLAAKNAVKEARRAMAKVLRKKLSELEAGTFEKAVVKLLHAQGFRELKVAKRAKEGPLLTCRRREGSVELRFAVRIAKGSSGIDRRAVQDLRRDLGHYSAQVGLVLSPGELRGDGKTEAQGSGALVMVWAGEALADKFLDAELGVSVARVELFELDEKFFEVARIDAEEAARRREERHREREKGRDERREVEPREPEAKPEAREEAAPQEPSAPAEPPPLAAAPGEAPAPVEADAEGEEGEEGEESDEELEAASAYVAGQESGAQPGQPGQPGERKRRRRRRRGRRGRGRAEGAPAPGGEGASAAPAEARPEPSAAPEPPPPAPGPSSSEGA